MKTTIKILPLFISLALLSAAPSVWAAGTLASTVINNKASISYSVGGTNQTPINSSEGGNSIAGAAGGSDTTFVVDKKVDLIVTGSTTPVNVTPGSTGNALNFTVTNQGNSVEAFSLDILATVGGDFDATSCVAAPSSFASLAIDTATPVVVTCSIPVDNLIAANAGGGAGSGDVTNLKTSVIDLQATVTGVSASTGVDDAATVQTVFADGIGTRAGDTNRNAKHSATMIYKINTATLTVGKTHAVDKMTLDLGLLDGTSTDVTTGDLYHIPGATIEYTITVANTGTVDASNVVVADHIPANMTYVDGTCSVAGGTCSAAVESLVINGVTADGVKTSALTVAAGATATVTFKATVN